MVTWLQCQYIFALVILKIKMELCSNCDIFVRPLSVGFYCWLGNDSSCYLEPVFRSSRIWKLKNGIIPTFSQKNASYIAFHRYRVSCYVSTVYGTLGLFSRHNEPSVNFLSVITDLHQSCGKVMFSRVFVCPREGEVVGYLWFQVPSQSHVPSG